MRPWTRQRQTVVLYVPSLSLKTLDTRILLLAVFKLELEMDYPSETNLCTVTPHPLRHTHTDTPYPICSEGTGRLYTGYLKRKIHLHFCYKCVCVSQARGFQCKHRFGYRVDTVIFK